MKGLQVLHDNRKERILIEGLQFSWFCGFAETMGVMFACVSN